MAGGATVGLTESVKQARLGIFANTDAGIGDGKLEFGGSGTAVGSRANVQGD